MENALGRKRNVFPRWRTHGRTISAELQSLEGKERPISADDVRARFEFLYLKWRDDPSLDNASEVLDSAVLLPDRFLAFGPAQAVLSDETAMPTIKELAQFVLAGVKADTTPTEPTLDLAHTRENHISKIRRIKTRLYDEPRNTVLWLEKARLQTQISDLAGAKASMNVALGTAPENREVLRAYARFMVHIDDPATGHARLVRSARLVSDPWIQAAELALAQSAGRKPHSAKRASTILDERKHGAVHLSELAAALGTLELLEGSAKQARKHFRQSLEAPTENALSQAIWVKEMLNAEILVPTHNLSVPCAFEARAHNAVSARRWADAVKNCKLWINDEPFSTRAAADGSFIASSFAWDAAAALEICDFGLIANPSEPTLLNNRAVSLIRMNRLPEAEAMLKQLRSLGGTKLEPYAVATQGLLHFAKGEFELGRSGYSAAMDIAAKSKNIGVQFRALSHWLYEEIVAGTLTKEDVSRIVKEMDSVAAKIKFVPATADLWAVMKVRASKESSERTPATEKLSDLPLLSHQLTAFSKIIYKGG